VSATPLDLPRSRRRGSADREGTRRAAEHIVYGVLPIVTTLALLVLDLKWHAVAVDFHVAYYPAGKRLLDGLSPYAATPRQVAAGIAFVYPALSAVLFAPFALIGRGGATVLYTLLAIACVPATLWTLNVRDWRLYGVAMLWFPIYDGWQSGNVTLPLMLIVALVWRHRDRALAAGLLSAAAISIKLFVWPLALWLLVTRRWKAAAWALASGAVFNLIAWGLVGFNEISTFLRLSSDATKALWKGGYSMLAIAHHLGLTRSAGESLLVVVSALAVAVLVYLALVRRNERGAFVAAIVLMLLASPLLWAHYFALLLVPLALYRPRLSIAWAFPLLMWCMPPRQPVYGWQEILAWTATAVMLTLALRTPRRVTAS
jgi:alpha-1,2-mannosyltransferase